MSSMKDKGNAHDSGLKIDLDSFAQPLLQPLREKHALVARKLSMATEQLQKAGSIEEYQQVGVLVRDAWIEFMQKLFSVTFVPQGAEIPSSSDVKKMIEYIVIRWPSRPRQLIRVAKALFDLANEVHHKRTIDVYSAKWCLLTTLSAMSIMLDLDSQCDKLANRKYYKCPQCGSLKLMYTYDQEVDYDTGPGAEYEIWGCQECDWEHFIYLG